MHISVALISCSIHSKTELYIIVKSFQILEIEIRIKKCLGCKNSNLKNQIFKIEISKNIKNQELELNIKIKIKNLKIKD